MDAGPGIWRALGIGETRDADAVRIAYARRLAAIDVDAGALAYVGLRQAYETALAWANGLKLTGSWQDGATASGDDWPREHARAEAWFAFDLPPRAEWFSEDLPPEFDELDRLFATVAGEGRRWLGAEEKLELRRCWAAIAADGGAGNARGVRWLICNWGPFAVGLVPFAVEHFRWDSVEDDSAAGGTIGEVLWRHRGIQFLQRVRRPGHPYHPAWLELTSPAPAGAGRGRVNPQQVHQLQAVARNIWPETETEFDAGRVALWKNNTADPAHPENPETRHIPQWMRVLFAIILGLWIFRFASAAFLLAFAWVYSLFE